MKTFLTVLIIIITAASTFAANGDSELLYEPALEQQIISGPAPELLNVNPEQYSSLSEQANVFYAQNDIKNALDTLLKIPEIARGAQNWLLIGNIMQDKGKLDEAEFMFKKAIEKDKKYYKAYYNLGNIYFQDEKINMAIEQYKKVIKIRPDYPYAHYNLGCAYIKLGKYSKAKFEFLTAVDLKNTIADFHYNLAYVYKLLRNEKQAKIYMEYYNKIMDGNV